MFDFFRKPVQIGNRSYHKVSVLRPRVMLDSSGQGYKIYETIEYYIPTNVSEEEFLATDWDIK